MDPYNSKLKVTPLSTIPTRPISWLWNGWLLANKTTMLSGMGGRGKTFLAYDLAARVSSGRAFPGRPQGDTRKPQKVLILAAEDDAADTIRPRLEAAGACIDNISILSMETMNSKSGKKREVKVRLDRDIEKLEGIVEEENIKLLVVDPITSYLGDKKSNDVGDTRDILDVLKMMTAEYNMAALLLTHLNKGGKGATQSDAANRTLGSGAFVHAPRMTWVLERDPDDRKLIRMAIQKCNLTQDDKGWEFRLVGEGQGMHVEWGQELFGIDANDILNATPKGISRVDEAELFLRNELPPEGEFVPGAKVLAAALERGIAKSTLKVARQQFGVKVRPRKGYQNGDEWGRPATKQGKRSTASSIPEDSP